MITPPASGAPPIVWAVFLGADTSIRLADEWGLKLADAGDRLQKAADLGLIRVVGKRTIVRQAGGKRHARAYQQRRTIVVYGPPLKERHAPPH